MTNKMKILMIDDSQGDRDLYKLFIEASSVNFEYEFIEADNAIKGLELHKTEQPDLILLDYSMPKVSGIEFMQMLNPEKSPIIATPIIVLTGMSDDDLAQEFLRLGAVDYINKLELNQSRLSHSLSIVYNKYILNREAILKLIEVNKRQSDELNTDKLIEELIKVKEEFAAFTYVASHDLNEPLRKVRAFSDKLKDKYSTVLDQKANQYLDIIHSASIRMQALLADLLDYSRTNTLELNPEPIDLNLLVDELKANLIKSLGLSQFDFNTGTLPKINANKTFMTQLFGNLIRNALMYQETDKRPNLNINAETANDCLEISIEDNGIGFEEGHKDRIFKPFERLHNRSSIYPGTGLGLSICRKIAERHSGSITAESTPNQGSIFTVKLPKEIIV